MSRHGHLSLLVVRSYIGCHTPAVPDWLLDAIDLMGKYRFWGINGELEVAPCL